MSSSSKILPKFLSSQLPVPSIHLEVPSDIGEKKKKDR